VYLVSRDGGTPRLLVDAQLGTEVPSWTHDGHSILFYDLGTDPTLGVLKTIDIETRQVSIIPDSGNLSSPVASPDGRYIAPASVDGQKLMLFDFTTRKWSDLLKMSVGWTTWSHDSQYIYFDTGLTENPAFYRVRVADRKLERIADLKGLRRVVNGWIPWSGITPDGSPILVRDIGSQEVYALDFETP
jgi:Tol biopolymer transport system component